MKTQVAALLAAAAFLAGCESTPRGRTGLDGMTIRETDLPGADNTQYADRSDYSRSLVHSTNERGAQVGSTGLDGRSAASNPDATRSQYAGGSSADTFIRKAAAGGEMEVEMGRIAAAQAADEKVRAFGQRMVTDHTKADNQLIELARAHGVTVPSALNEKKQAMCDQLRGLSGEAFDRKYMAMMLKDHVKDVREFENVAANSTDADVRGFAERTLPTLRQHLALAQSICADLGIGSGTTTMSDAREGD